MSRVFAYPIALAAALCGAPAGAATTTAEVAISATVVGTCSVAGATLSFGAYTPGSVLQSRPRCR